MVRLVCCEDGRHFIVVCWMNVFINAVSRQLYLLKWTFVSELWHIRPSMPEEIALSCSNQPATGPSGRMQFLICTLFSHLERPQKWSHLMSERKKKEVLLRSVFQQLQFTFLKATKTAIQDLFYSHSDKKVSYVMLFLDSDQHFMCFFFCCTCTLGFVSSTYLILKLHKVLIWV